MESKQRITINRVTNASDLMGIRIKNEDIHLYIPGFLRLENEDNLTKKDKTTVLSFLRSINIAKTINKDGINKDISEGNSWPIESYLWIIRDFLENGFYFNRERLYYSDNKGKIVWKKTFRNNPIINNGNIIFDKLVTTRVSQNDSDVTDIYKICLANSIDKMRWLYNINIKIDIKQTKSPNEMLYVIKKELSNTFDDEKRCRFNHMIKILQLTERDDMLSSNYTYWINNYYYVYERMVDCLFEGIKDEKEKKKYNPSGLWKLKGEDLKEASNLRPDTIHKKTEDELFIIDAKMYQYGYTKVFGDLPETSSIQKQITYGDYIINNLRKDEDVKVRNVFVLPYDKEKEEFKNDVNIEKLNDGNLAYIGEALAGWRNNSELKDHERIFTFLVDFNYLLNNYKFNDDACINELCKKIEQLLSAEN